MTQHYEADGVSFDYPDDWKLDREESADGWTVQLQSADTAFLTLTCDCSGATADEIATAALDALKAEYPTLEVQAQVDSLAGQMAVGHDISILQPRPDQHLLDAQHLQLGRRLTSLVPMQRSGTGGVRADLARHLRLTDGGGIGGLIYSLR
jgi:hypothetical protein